MKKKPALTGFWLGLAVFFFFSGPGLPAENRASIKLSSLMAASAGWGGELAVSCYGAGRFSFQSQNNRNVKGLFALDAQIGSTSLLSVYRAWIQVDFPVLRITTGKARLSWGEGIYFNAGDVLYGSTSLSVSLSESVFRDEARLLQAVYLPFGLFSYIEVLYMPPEYDYLQALINAGGPSSVQPDFRFFNSDAGARIVSQILGIKVEAGYIYKGDDPAHSKAMNQSHNPYVSLQGHLGADLYLSASTKIDVHKPGTDFTDNFLLSAGGFYMKSFTGGTVLTFRLEAIARPWGIWEAKAYSAGPAAAPNYGIFLYPEIVWTPDRSFSMTLNGLFSPVDNSSNLALTASWNVYQGLRLLGSLSVQAGDSGDIFCHRRPGGIVFVLGAEYIY